MYRASHSTFVECTPRVKNTYEIDKLWVRVRPRRRGGVSVQVGGTHERSDHDAEHNSKKKKKINKPVSQRQPPGGHL